MKKKKKKAELSYTGTDSCVVYTKTEDFMKILHPMLINGLILLAQTSKL